MGHMSQAVVKMLVDLKRRKVKSFKVLPVRGLLPAMEMCCTLQRHSQSVSMGLSGVQSIMMHAQLASSLAQVMGL